MTLTLFSSRKACLDVQPKATLQSGCSRTYVNITTIEYLTICEIGKL